MIDIQRRDFTEKSTGAEVYLQGSDDSRKYVLNYYYADRSNCIKISELRDLINYFNYSDPKRIFLLLLTFTGCRSSAIGGLRISDFKDQCRQVEIQEVKSKWKQYKTGTMYKNIPIIRRTLPDFVAKEIFFYFRNNFHTFKNGRIFDFNANSMRRYFNNIRARAFKVQKGIISDEKITPTLIKALTDKDGFKFSNLRNMGSHYRVGLHSIRRTFETYFYYMNGCDFSRLARYMGYTGTNSKETAMLYTYRPEDIGLTPELIKQKTKYEDLFFSPDQKRLNEFK